MRPSTLILILPMFLTGNCKKQTTFSLNSNRENQVIAIQPIDNYDMNQIDSVVEEISKFYNKRVVILKNIILPTTFRNGVIQKYSADSIVILLSKLQNKNITEIIGITNKPIYTIKDAKPQPYYDDKIFGMSHEPGNSCIISDYRFKNTNPTIFRSRMRKIIIHEVGHNLDLPHCKDNSCIMSPSNGYLYELDKNAGMYCKKCKAKLTREITAANIEILKAPTGAKACRS